VETIGYQNAGTVEFLMDSEKNLYFMEMNTRLQVEHPVTEMISGRDIVQEQLRIAAGHRLSFTQEEISLKGHAIECRINAEDPSNDFVPSPGKIKSFEPRLDAGPGEVRLDTHVREGYEIPVYYDSMICKVIAHGKDRKEAIATMSRALRDFRIEGIKTTIPLHLEILDSEVFRSGEYNTGSLDSIRKE
jgi:acetyl-CoA carboxylase biotin carboxylase subunit